MEIDLENKISRIKIGQPEPIEYLKTSIDVNRLKKPPKSWYYLGSEKDIKKTPTPFSPWGKALIAYKDNENIVVQHRHCIHMNTDLMKGKIVNGSISCPMHAWKFNAQGKCTEIPGGNHNDCKMRLPTFPTLLFTNKRLNAEAALLFQHSQHSVISTGMNLN